MTGREGNATESVTGGMCKYAASGASSLDESDDGVGGGELLRISNVGDETAIGELEASGMSSEIRVGMDTRRLQTGGENCCRIRDTMALWLLHRQVIYHVRFVLRIQTYWVTETMRP